jgi:hypothetical protein
MWCSSSDIWQPSRGGARPHHRIVRIPPGESVVLNSAERAPYLLFIEILNNDLDFEPSKRNNKEILKRIVTKEAERSGASLDLISFVTSMAQSHKHSQEQANSSHAMLDEDTNSTEQVVVTPATPATADFTQPDNDEEMDLVEQLYGTDRSIRSQPIDLSESIVLPPTPKNKELDMATWSRSSSLSLSPFADSNVSQPSPASTKAQVSRQLFSNSYGGEDLAAVNVKSRILSLDDYSGRMRTAAIMLAQLNANLVREPLTVAPGPGMPTNIPETTSSALSWLPGSSWLGNSPDLPGGGPVHPSLKSGPHDSNVASTGAPTRMKLQYAEASAIRDRIMKEMLSLEEERMERMRENREGDGTVRIADIRYGTKNTEDDSIIRRELNRADPSAIVFSESWAAKKVIYVILLYALMSS